jgi:GMP synthase-like glutamine amidotransferase
MKLAILKTGRPPRSLASDFPGYPEMFRATLGPGYDYVEFDVENGPLPPPGAAQGYLLTGSAAGVYDDLPWIAPLRGWLRAADPAVPVMGICFGHQIMADAYGGVVIKSEKGWGGGLHDYTVTAPEPWMKDAAATFSIPAAHQDQVVKVPPAAGVIAASDFCPNAGLAYTTRRAASFQGHPEFSTAYATALIELRRRKNVMDNASADAALATLRRPDDCGLVAGWIRTFFER